MDTLFINANLIRAVESVFFFIHIFYNESNQTHLRQHNWAICPFFCMAINLPLLSHSHEICHWCDDDNKIAMMRLIKQSGGREWRERKIVAMNLILNGEFLILFKVRICFYSNCELLWKFIKVYQFSCATLLTREKKLWWWQEINFLNSLWRTCEFKCILIF